MHPFGPHRIPALRIERQADLTAVAARALVRTKAPPRALVISPREAIDLDPPTCPTCGRHEAVMNDDPEDGTLFCREHGDEMAGNAIDGLTDATAHPDDKATRKRRLLRGPEEFRDTLIDRSKKGGT